MRTRDIIVLFACLSLGGVVLLVGALRYTVCVNDLDWILGPTGRVAVYDHMEFEISDGTYFAFSTSGKVANIHIRSTATGESFLLPTLTEQQLQKLYDRVTCNVVDGKRYCKLGNQWSMCIFENGALATCFLTDRQDIQIGPSENGPFIALPAKTSDVHRIFGKPIGHKRIKLPRT